MINLSERVNPYDEIQSQQPSQILDKDKPTTEQQFQPIEREELNDRQERNRQALQRTVWLKNIAYFVVVLFVITVLIAIIYLGQTVTTNPLQKNPIQPITPSHPKDTDDSDKPDKLEIQNEKGQNKKVDTNQVVTIVPVEPLKPAQPNPESVQNKPNSPNNPVKPKEQIVAKPLQTSQKKATNQITSTLIEPSKIYQIEKLKQLKELPFCLLVVPSQKYSKETIQQFINEQKYQNYKTLVVTYAANYSFYKSEVNKKCADNSVIMFVGAPLKSEALKYMNEHLQTYRAWLLYTEDDQAVEVLAFYLRIYDLLQKNDFDPKNPLLQQSNRLAQTLSFFDLCQESSKKIEKSRVFISEDELTFFAVEQSEKISGNRRKYNQIHRLSQDFKQFNNTDYHSKLKTFNISSPPSQLQLSAQKMYRALDRQEVWYLPHNHSINQLEFLDYNEKYEIENYREKSQQVRFCVTIMSHNNIQADRYIKVLKSIVQQEYQNYHLVFIDDVSTDTTLDSTIEYLAQLGFPRNRVTYVKNLQRNYATYNTINAAFNYCHEDEVQMLIYGGDELVGKYAFQVLNSRYQKNPDLWVVYSNYKTDFIGYGKSWKIKDDSEHIDKKTGKRKHLSFLGPIRTWRVKLFYHITLENYKMQNGEWLDMDQDALIHPIVELATLKRMEYVNEMIYEQNRGYDKEDSNEQKILQLYEYLSGVKMLTKIDTLNGSQPNAEVMKELKAGYGIRYKNYQK